MKPEVDLGDRMAVNHCGWKPKVIEKENQVMAKERQEYSATDGGPTEPCRGRVEPRVDSSKKPISKNTENPPLPTLL